MVATTQDKFVIESKIGLKQNFYIHAQHIIEQYYLQPLILDNHDYKLPIKSKSNLKDGVLERLVQVL